MEKETYAAVLRLVNPEQNKGFSISYTLPNTNKPTVIRWDEKNNYEAQVPTKITYVDDHKKTVLWQENYALNILNSYGVKKAKKPELQLLEFVKELNRPVFDKNSFTEDKFAPEEVTESSKETKPKGK